MIDKSTNNEINSSSKNDSQIHAKKTRGVGFALFIAFLALFFTAAGIAAGYKHWQRMSDRAKNNARKIAALEEVIAAKSDNKVFEALRQELNDSHTAQQETLADNLKQMQQMHSQARQFSSTVADQIKQITSLQHQLKNTVTPKGTEDWQFAEVEFLLKLANRELHLSGNKEAASKALREADQLLSANASTDYLPVRQQIANDLAALEAMDIPDISLISQQITVLSRQLKPVIKDVSETEANPKKAATTPPDNHEKTATSKWDNYKNKATSLLNDALIIRQLDKSLNNELSIEAREQAYQLLQLRLEALRLMTLQRQDEAYHRQIRLIRDTVNAYYPPEQFTAIGKALDQLATVNLSPSIPDISGSQQALRKARLAEVGQ